MTLCLVATKQEFLSYILQAAHRQVLRGLRGVRGPRVRGADAAVAAAVQGRFPGLLDLQQRVHEQGVLRQAALHAAPLLQATL